jgi:hypothetical protein
MAASRAPRSGPGWRARRTAGGCGRRVRVGTRTHGSDGERDQSGRVVGVSGGEGDGRGEEGGGGGRREQEETVDSEEERSCDGR